MKYPLYGTVCLYSRVQAGSWMRLSEKIPHRRIGRAAAVGGKCCQKFMYAHKKCEAVMGMDNTNPSLKAILTKQSAIFRSSERLLALPSSAWSTQKCTHCIYLGPEGFPYKYLEAQGNTTNTHAPFGLQ